MKYDDGKECLCSALAINCFQLGCFMHNRPRCNCAHRNNDWMTNLTAQSPEKKLRDLVIPGTHDSASVTISKWAPFSAVGLCQNVSIFEQLCRGARYLDLRIGGNNKSTLVDDINIVHGILKGAPFPNIVEEIDNFLTENPREFVVVEIIFDPRKHNMPPEQRHGCLQLLSSTFGERITKEDVDSWFNLSTVTLGELEKKKKNIILLINDGMCNFSYIGTEYDFDTIAHEFGCHDHGQFMKNKWHNTAHAGTLLRSNETFLAEGSDGGCQEMFMNSQFVMTPQPPGGVSDTVGLLVGLKSLRPVSLARELYRKDLLETFIRDNAENRWNIVLLDFIDLCPQLVRFLIGLNSPKQLKVKEATVTSKDGSTNLDVTEAMTKLKRRNNSIFLLDFKTDLEMTIDEGTLKAKLQFDDEDYIDHVIPFDQDTEYLLSDM